MIAVSEKGVYTLRNIIGEVIAEDTVKVLSTFLTLELEIPCTTSALYRTIAMGGPIYGMSISPKGKRLKSLAHGFGEANAVYKYFQDVPVAKYSTMSEAASKNNLTVKELKHHMYNLTNMGDLVFLPYKISMLKALKERTSPSDYTGGVFDTTGKQLFRYRSRLDLELKLRCDSSRVTKLNILEEKVPLLNNGVLVISDTKKFI